MGNACSWPGEKATRTKNTRHDAVSKRRNGILEWVIQRVLACSSNSIICYRLYEVVRSVESITILLIRNGPIVWPVLSDWLSFSVLVEERREKKLESRMDF